MPPAVRAAKQRISALLQNGSAKHLLTAARKDFKVAWHAHKLELAKRRAHRLRDLYRSSPRKFWATFKLKDFSTPATSISDSVGGEFFSTHFRRVLSGSTSPQPRVKQAIPCDHAHLLLPTYDNLHEVLHCMRP